jgi:DNA mismatch repair protein MutH
MTLITRIVAVVNLKQYIGQDLAMYAARYGVMPFKDGKQNKGWKGLILERLAGLTNNSDKAPDGLDFELKSVSFVRKNGVYVPKETMAITMINPTELAAHSFYESHCWAKLQALVLCAVEWNAANATEAKLLEVTSLDFLKDAEIIKEVAEDYEFIRQKLINDGFSALTGKDGKWIQARTKGPGHGSISRAFYAKTPFLIKVLEEAKHGEI